MKQMYVLTYVAEEEIGFLPFLFTPTPGYLYPKLDVVLELLDIQPNELYDVELLPLNEYLDLTGEDWNSSSNPDVMEPPKTANN